MNAYVVSYDLNKPGQNYQPLYDALKSKGTWWHYLDSTWLLATDETPSQIWERIEGLLDESDGVLIMQVCDNRAGRLKKDAWDWINKNVPGCQAVALTVRS